jgi:hypothetical protein
MNVVCTGHGRFVEVQGTAESQPFDRAELDTLPGQEAGHFGPGHRWAVGASGARRPRPGPRRTPASCGPLHADDPVMCTQLRHQGPAGPPEKGSRGCVRLLADPGLATATGGYYSSAELKSHPKSLVTMTPRTGCTSRPNANCASTTEAAILAAWVCAWTARPTSPPPTATTPATPAHPQANSSVMNATLPGPCREIPRIFFDTYQLQAKVANSVKDAVQVGLIADLPDEDAAFIAAFEGEPTPRRRTRGARSDGPGPRSCTWSSPRALRCSVG